MINKKVLLSISVLSGLFLSINAYATVPGVYVGIQPGWGKVHDGGLTNADMDQLTVAAIGSSFTRTSFNVSTKGTGFAGRIFAGYQWDPMWAAELGWMKFRNSTSNATAAGQDISSGLAYTATASSTKKTTAVDLVLKGIYPMQSNFSVFGKFGVAYLMQRNNANGAFTEIRIGTRTSSTSSKQNKFLPTFGLGVDYAFSPNFSADLSWMRIQKVGNSNIGSTDFVSVGLIAHA